MQNGVKENRVLGILIHSLTLNDDHEQAKRSGRSALSAVFPPRRPGPGGTDLPLQCSKCPAAHSLPLPEGRSDCPQGLVSSAWPETFSFSFPSAVSASGNQW